MTSNSFAGNYAPLLKHIGRITIIHFKAQMKNSDNIALIRRFIEACARADADEFTDYFCDDAVWWNAPWQAIVGREAIRETLRRRC